MIIAIIFWTSLAFIAWIYAGYPLVLVAVGRVRPRPRVRRPLHLPVSVIVAAHNEAAVIADKIADVRAAAYPQEQLEIVVASDGSDDRTVECARAAGVDVVLDLPRMGKLRALNEAVARSRGEILVFTDADSRFRSDTLLELVSNFADPNVGAVAANERHVAATEDAAVAKGEGLYWRYEQRLKQLEDRVGSTVSASGRLYATRRSLFAPSDVIAGTDDFVVSTQAIGAGMRLAFDVHTRVFVDAPSEGGTELRRKVRVMNRGLRAAIALARSLSPARHGPYLAQLLFHKILRRFVAFFLILLVLAPSVGVARGDNVWLFALAPQLLFYALAAAGALAARSARAVPRLMWIPYYFVLSNLAAGLAVLSLARGTRIERWEPAQTRGTAMSGRPNV